jgi:hypothetical protein
MEHGYSEFVLGTVRPVGVERIGNGVRGGDHHSAVSRMALDVINQRRNAVVVDNFHRSLQPPALERLNGEALGFLCFGFGLVGRGLAMQQLAEGLGDVEQTQIVQKIQSVASNSRFRRSASLSGSSVSTTIVSLMAPA